MTNEYETLRQREDRIHRMGQQGPPPNVVYIHTWTQGAAIQVKLPELAKLRAAGHEVCDCEFTPYDDGDTEESWHYKRTCLHCGHQWFGLHCIHDGHQNPCPGCNVRPTPIPETA